jgi:hypothetical protein
MKAFALTGLIIMSLGTALGATLVYGQRVNTPDTRSPVQSTAIPTPEQIAAWKATASISDYLPPKAPL